MLRSLDIKNVAVIEKISVDFKHGMTVLTGETGAGKSIIIDSINMILGARANKALIRRGEEKARVSAVFDTNAALEEKLGEFGVDCDDDCVILSREISQDGKSTARINGIPVPSAVLKDVSAYLVNIHGQQDNQAILNSARHMDFLDTYAETEAELAAYSAKYAEMRETEAELEKSKLNEEERLRRVDLLKYQTEEIEKADLKAGEKEELESERVLILNSGKIAENTVAAYSALYESESGSAYDAVSVAEHAMSELAELDPQLGELAARLADVKYSIEDIVHELRGMETEYDENTLNETEERLDRISRLEKKYGGSVEAVLEFYENASEELEKMINSDEYIKGLEERLTIERGELTKLGDVLYEKRKKAAAELSKRITAELADLDMEKAEFAVDLVHTAEFFKNGADRAEFMIITNPGEPFKPLTKIASGGELSRVMLAVKTVLAESGEKETLIFDEIDTGVSGKAAQKIAAKLWELGRSNAVICISHQPQLAAFADNHIYIEKIITDDSASTSIKELNDEQRRREVARIIDGADITDAALAHAGEMIDLAKEKKNRRKCG